MKDRISYELDPHNRLIVKKSGGRSNVRKFRKVLNGRGVDAIVLKGKWDIKDRNEIRYEITIDVTCGKKIERRPSFTCKYRPGAGREIVLEAIPSGKALNIRLGAAYLESFLKDKERYLGGGIAFRW